MLYKDVLTVHGLGVMSADETFEKKQFYNVMLPVNHMVCVYREIAISKPPRKEFEKFVFFPSHFSCCAQILPD